ncbi:MAG: GDSL-type esterase/lipase family protein, partial [Akkermansiaceae bacterium]
MRFFILLLLTAALVSANPIKVAVIGDSITFGAGAEVRENNRYSSRLGHLLGNECIVRTFGASSLCMLRDADRPFVKTKLLQEALQFKPDIAVITLGTNDTCQNDNRKNWEHNSHLQRDSQFLIDQLRKANPNMVVHLCSPPPMFPNQPGLKPDRKKDLTERAKRLPAIRQAYAATAARTKDVHFHDLTRALSPSQTTDGVHPHTFGHERIAHHLRDILTQPAGKRANFDKISRARSQWHGFEMHRHRLPKTGANYTLVIPHTAAKGQPWIWRTRFFGHQPALDLALLDRGYHLAYVDVGGLFGADEAMKRGDEFYHFLTTNFNLNKKCIMEGMSRGGLMIFNYTAKHPDRVSAVYGDNPVCDFKSWPGGKSGKFSKSDWAACLKAYGITGEQAAKHPQITDPSFVTKLKNTPVALVIGTADKVVPPAENAELVAKHYAAAGGPLKVWRKPGLGHHPHGLSPVDPLLRFLLRADGRKKNPAATPSPSSEYRRGAGWGGTWWQAFAHLKAQAKKHSDAKIVFLGDSITQGLTGHGNRGTVKGGRRAIDRHFGEQKAISLGLSGDRTEHILFRLNNGQIDDLKPEHLVLMIGVNNINAAGHTGEEVAGGTKAIVAWFKKNRPEIKVHLLGCFPTQKTATHPARAEVKALHQGIKTLADNKTIFYHDLRPLFLNADGTMNDRMGGDAIHINGKGQEA